MTVKSLNKQPYQQAYYPPRPTVLTLFLRNSVIWQAVRFLVINFKMLKLMGRSQHNANGHS